VEFSGALCNVRTAGGKPAISLLILGARAADRAARLINHKMRTRASALHFGF
jgi:hypothetical protein